MVDQLGQYVRVGGEGLVPCRPLLADVDTEQDILTDRWEAGDRQLLHNTVVRMQEAHRCGGETGVGAPTLYFRLRRAEESLRRSQHSTLTQNSRLVH